MALNATPQDIRDLAHKNGMKTPKEYGKYLMAEGLTSVDEVLMKLVTEA